MFAEQQTEYIINSNLVNRNWVIDNSDKKNVFFQTPPFEEHKKKLKGKRPDYILYQTGTTRPIAIIEAKKGGVDLKNAIKQGTEYAEALECPLVFAMNGSYCETRFVPNGKELILNRNEVRELIREVEALEFINKNTNEVCTIPEEILISREELIRVFKNLNDILRGEGLRAGIERFSEFSNILFLKLMSENNKKSWWNSIKSQGNDDMIGYINSYVINQVKHEYGGDVFTPLLIKNPKTIRNIIDKLDSLVLSTIDTDVKGDAFEYFLEQTTSTENDLGEYFTPRHIVKSIVNLVDPKFKETVYDPFCGTGGFLTSAFHHIKENSIIEGGDDLTRLRRSTLFGREITTTARIAKMNMVLHGDGHSGIEQIDTLANPLDKKHDIIITNMPFSQKTEEGWRYQNGLARKNGDATCVLHCLNALKDGGRMALVVPEGFLFRKDIARVREYLLSKCTLQSVISLPQGTFLPYTGVKTDILYFTNAHEANNQKDYWYFDVKNIGFTLDNHRRKIKGKNDLNKLAESDFKKANKSEEVRQNILDIGFEIIPMEKVKANDYNLVGTRYREVIRHNGKWEIVKLGEVCECYQPKTITGNEILQAGEYKVYGANGVIGFYNQYNHENEEVAVTCRGATCGCVHLTESKSWITGNSMVCSPKDVQILDKKYLYYMLSEVSMKTIITGSAQPQIIKSNIETLQIPLPPLAEQQKLVDVLDKIQSSIQSAKNLIESLKSEGGGYLFYLGMRIFRLYDWVM